MKVLRGSLILLLLMLMGTAFAQNSYNLEYKFQKGKTYRFQIDGDNTVTQSIMGQEMKVISKTHLINRLQVEDVDKNGNMVLLSSLDSGWVSTKMPMKDTTIQLVDMVSARRVVVDKLGNVLSSKPVDTTKTAGQMDEMIQNQLTQFFILSEKPVKQGETWKSSRVDTMNMMGGNIVNTMDMEYSVSGTESKQGRNTLKVPFTGKATLNGTASMMGQELFIEGTGKMTGAYNYDNARGMVTYSETALDYDMTMATKGENNMIIPITQSTKATYRLLD